VATTLPFTIDQIATAQRYAAMTPPTEIDPRIESLVTDLIARVADKWTMLILEVLAEKGTLRFSRLAEAIDGARWAGQSNGVCRRAAEG